MSKNIYVIEILNLELEFKNACLKWEFSEEKNEIIKNELTKRAVKYSFLGMPENLIKSMLRHEIQHLYDYGNL